MKHAKSWTLFSGLALSVALIGCGETADNAAKPADGTTSSPPPAVTPDTGAGATAAPAPTDASKDMPKDTGAAPAPADAPKDTAPAPAPADAPKDAAPAPADAPKDAPKDAAPAPAPADAPKDAPKV